MRDAAYRIDPHLLGHGDIGAAWIGRDQRAARLPEVAFGVEMQHLRAHTGIVGALQDTVGAAADRVSQRRIAERELVVAIGVILVLARIAAGLRKLPVNAGATRPRNDRKDAVEHLASGEILVEPQMHQIPKHTAALRDAETKRAPNARAPLRRQRVVFRFMAQE